MRILEPYRLTLGERPHINGLLLDTKIALATAEAAGDADRVEVQRGREAALQRLLLAFPVDL